ncbi:hypothetical protein [Poseidonibacter lekithochrous]|uniref:hypothetical protein n=1 Tax=Poseidonibacter lekithochrous TaxID=1904463 RepID=UPI0008FC3F68|nr:hypothetical protein [Poseidonibacter lekithochrous]QKJ23231.1 hypothetical protein ALEK_1968 [Poseidonibacter lekithochrous]
MEKIRDKLSKINENWNKFYINKEFFQKKINFTDEVKINYYGDLNFYLTDTLSLIKNFDHIDTDEDYISNIIVLLQVIYTHQDLIDELLYIFKLCHSELKDKNPNRQIRNELIGHPVSRDKKGKLKSSVLFDIMNKSKDTINYTKYSSLNNFKPSVETYKVEDILSNHYLFLNKYLDLILKKNDENISEYQKKLNKIFTIPLNNQFCYIKYFDKNLISNLAYIFENESLEYYYINMRKHRRYLFCLKQYKKVLLEVIRDIPTKTNYYHLIKSYDYEQLNKKDSVFTIDFYLDKYKENKLVYKELLNMKNNKSNNKEYYASLNFLWNYESSKPFNN